jgi:hypothetical protein
MADRESFLPPTTRLGRWLDRRFLRSRVHGIFLDFILWITHQKPMRVSEMVLRTSEKALMDFLILYYRK